MNNRDYLKTLEWIPSPCLVHIASYLDISTIGKLMKTSTHLSERIKHEVFPSYKSILLSFTYGKPTYGKPGMARIHRSPPFNRIRFRDDFTEWMRNDEIFRMLVSRRYNEVEIVIESENLDYDRIIWLECFLGELPIYGRSLTKRYILPNNDYLSNITYNNVLSPLRAIRDLSLVEKFTLDICDCIPPELEDIFMGALNVNEEYTNLNSLKLFRVNVPIFTETMKHDFESMVNRFPQCKFELALANFSETCLQDQFRMFTNSKNVTTLDLIQYEYIYFYDWNWKDRVMMNIELLEKLVRYLPHLTTLKTIIGDCHPHEWLRLIQKMSSLTNLELLYWFKKKQSEKVDWKNVEDKRFIPLSNIQHLTMYINTESHDDFSKFLTAIKFPSLKTFKIITIKFLDLDRCGVCHFQEDSTDWDCIYQIYSPLADGSPELESFIAFDQELLKTFKEF
ncbi:hypothetical protein RDWZM_010369 [Blomia tropicalis]|uniref:F-box domain-containing protein n=1 Tax=Blomia tropicalis TaxID=40697 RepID=A0A9Q0LYY8_BLOTA|nr:hypothetical protein RDWZM_010369 [Blomia tropicalis]